jgi:hypothetical protein
MLTREYNIHLKDNMCKISLYNVNNRFSTIIKIKNLDGKFNIAIKFRDLESISAIWNAIDDNEYHLLVGIIQNNLHNIIDDM